jgi:hypothetical protein
MGQLSDNINVKNVYGLCEEDPIVATTTDMAGTPFCTTGIEGNISFVLNFNGGTAAAGDHLNAGVYHCAEESGTYTLVEAFPVLYGDGAYGTAQEILIIDSSTLKTWCNIQAVATISGTIQDGIMLSVVAAFEKKYA